MGMGSDQKETISVNKYHFIMPEPGQRSPLTLSGANILDSLTAVSGI